MEGQNPSDSPALSYKLTSCASPSSFFKAPLLACAGLLNSHRATSNKRAFEWVKSFGHYIQWEHPARWVHDGKLWTSSGIAAGIDMTAALITELMGEDERDRICGRAEIVITKNSKNDPFAGEPTALAYS